MPDTKTVHIECPTCSTEKEIEVPEKLFKGKRIGLIKVNIERGICCNHQFIAFFSKSGKNLGYEKLDVIYDISESENESIDISLKDLIRDFGSNLLILTFHAVLLNVPTIVLHSQSDYINRAAIFNLMFREYFPERFHNTIYFQRKHDMIYHKRPRDDAFVISSANVAETTPWPKINYEFEANLIKKAEDILDEKMQTLLFREEINRLFEKAEALKELIKSAGKISKDVLVQMYLKRFPDDNERLLELLLQILEFRFRMDLDNIKGLHGKRRRLR